MKNILIVLVFLIGSHLVNAKTPSNNKTVKTTSEIEKEANAKTNTKKIKVHGMACPLCQSKAEKKFKEVAAVESVDVDMEKMLITLKLKKNMDLSEEKIKSIVKSLGLSFVKVIK